MCFSILLLSSVSNVKLIKQSVTHSHLCSLNKHYCVKNNALNNNLYKKNIRAIPLHFIIIPLCSIYTQGRKTQLTSLIEFYEKNHSIHVRCDLISVILCTR